MKRGAEGVVACFEGALQRAGAPPIALVDPSGAGDAFAGALLAALAGRRSVGVALEAACRAGAAAAASRRLWPSLSRRSKDGSSATAATDAS